jgi:sugar phosphate isomerase/epimerase
MNLLASNTRRSFLKTASLATAAGLLHHPARAKHHKSTAASDGLKIGIASYSLRKLSREDAIAAVQSMGTPYINLKSFHMPYELSAKEIAAARAQFTAASLQIVGGGTISLKKDNDDDIRTYFDYAKAAGMPLMVIAPIPEALPRIEKFVKAYDIKVAIHNHGPEDSHFPAPSDALKLIRNMDPRVGVCMDIGHTMRTGTDPIQAAADAGNRLLDLHLKDLRDTMAKDSQCEIGQGAIPFPAFFRQLQKMNYSGYANLEYEIDAETPVPGMRRSIAYLRGVLAGLGAA